MSEWLEPVLSSLADRRDCVDVFFRDDDGGWDDAALLRLVDQFASAGVPLDLAIIPSAVSPALAGEVRGRAGRGLGVHQHGWTHTNHEGSGRKCEFGPSRTAVQQRADVREGHHRLGLLFGDVADPIFTPPWNRCEPATVDALKVLGFRALSRSVGAKALPCPAALQELPVAVDWQKWRSGDGPDRDAIAREVAAAICTNRPANDAGDEGGGAVGIMLHHAPMTDADFRALRELLHVLGTHQYVRCRAMRELLLPAQAVGSMA